MKYISLDVETTGLEPKAPDRLIMVSMVFEDPNVDCPNLMELDHLTFLIDQGEFKGEPEALGMNGWIMKEIGKFRRNKDKPDYKPMFPVVTLGVATQMMLAFIQKHFGKENATIAGKNVASFDYWFLPPAVRRRIKHRMIDVGNQFINFKEHKSIPSLQDLHFVYGPPPGTEHHAYFDSLDNIRLLRLKY